MANRFLHVGLTIRDDGHLWELLALLERHGRVANVEIRHIPEPVNGDAGDGLTDLALLPPIAKPVRKPPKPMRGPHVNAVLQAMQPGRPTSPRKIAGPSGLTGKQAAMALYHLLKNGRVARPQPGIYVRIAP